MAVKRMFSQFVVMSDDFLDMPASTRCLYFALGMVADDDGFVNNPRSIMRQCGASPDDLKVLISKGYVYLFQSGVIVILHWRVNNYLRSDRYTPTKYVVEKAAISSLENDVYAVTGTPSGTPVGMPDGTPVGIPVGAPVGDTGKVSKGQNSCFVQSSLARDADFAAFWAAYPRKQNKKAAMKAFDKVHVSIEVLLSAVERQRQTAQWQRDNGQYIPLASSWLNQERWTDEIGGGGAANEEWF